MKTWMTKMNLLILNHCCQTQVHAKARKESFVLVAKSMGETHCFYRFHTFIIESECWNKWLRIDPEKFEIEQFSDINDPSLFEAKEIHANLKCPICMTVCSSWTKIRFG